MASESSNEVLATRSDHSRTLIFTLLGAVVCTNLAFFALERKDENRANSETDISSLSTQMTIPAQSSLAEQETARVPAEATKSFSGDSEFASIKQFKPDSFLNDAERPDFGRDRQSPKVEKKISEEELQNEDEESKERREKARAEYADEAARFRNLQLKDEKGEIPLDGLEKAKEQLNDMQADQQRRSKGKRKGLDVAGLAPSDWVWQGPGNIGGRIRSIVINPVDPNKMWVGSVGGGIWKTTNAGTTWSPVDDFLANLAVSTMVIDPTDPNIMYAGTGEGVGNSDALQGDGIFKSIDGGVTWNRLAQTRIADPTVCPAGMPCPWTYVNRLAISPDGTTILAATAFGIQRSTNAGATWSRGTTTGAFLDVDFDPTNSQLAIAGANGFRVTRRTVAKLGLEV